MFCFIYFFSFWSSKPRILDLDPLVMLDPDSMNPDPQL
jgi:hypothetical protein